MKVRTVWLPLVILVVMTASASAQTGDSAAGKALWDGPTTFCKNCHGGAGEGGFGPDLAGRQLSLAQFQRAVRQPWGVMPAFTEQQVSDEQMANLSAYFSSLPRVAEPAAWRVPAAASASLGQQFAISNGCAQCHGADLAILRQALGSVGMDYAWFARLVYTHTAEMPGLEVLMGNNAPMRMGNFSRLRVPDSVLQEIWKYVSVDLGPRARITASAVVAAVPQGATYTVTVENRGIPEKGNAADGVSVNLALPAGATVVATTGAGYQGTRKDAGGADVATWQVNRMGPKDRQVFTITLSGAVPVTAGTVTWAKPAQRNGAMGDSVSIALPRPQR